MLKWFFIFLFGGIATVAISLYFKLGAYKDVQVEVKDVPAMHIVYKKHFGPYHKISPVIELVEAWAVKNDIQCFTSFGLYIDDPKETDADRLKSEGGCLIKGAVAKENLPLDFEQKTLPAKKYIVATFTGSPAIGPFVVYPKASEWAIENRFKLLSPTIETYQMENKQVVTTYLFNYE